MSVVIPSRGAAAAFRDSRGYLPSLVGVEHGLLVSGGEECPGGGGESSESSSIGVNEESSLSLSSSSSSKDEKDGEVQSELRKNPLGCLASLEDSLPIKKGLSNFFNGKSKSFRSLSEAAEAGDLVKKENPFNKKRRILTACKSSWRRRASCTSLVSTSSMQGFLHSLEETQKEEEEEEDEEEEEEEEEEEPKRSLPLPHKDRRIRSFRSPSCLSINDLHQHINQN